MALVGESHSNTWTTASLVALWNLHMNIVKLCACTITQVVHFSNWGTPVPPASVRWHGEGSHFHAAGPSERLGHWECWRNTGKKNEMDLTSESLNVIDLNFSASSFNQLPRPRLIKVIKDWLIVLVLATICTAKLLLCASFGFYVHHLLLIWGSQLSVMPCHASPGFRRSPIEVWTPQRLRGSDTSSQWPGRTQGRSKANLRQI